MEPLSLLGQCLQLEDKASTACPLQTVKITLIGTDALDANRDKEEVTAGTTGQRTSQFGGTTTIAS